MPLRLAILPPCCLAQAACLKSALLRMTSAGCVQVLNKRPPGKENGMGGYTAKEELPSAPPNLPNMPAHRRTESRGYDRYAEPAY